MTNIEENPQQSRSDDPAEKIVLHLRQHPFDLVDAAHLMKRFGASADDVWRALSTLEQSTLSYEEEPAC